MQLLRWLDEDLGGGCQNPKGFGPRVPRTQREAALAALCSQVFTYLSLWVGSIFLPAQPPLLPAVAFLLTKNRFFDQQSAANSKALRKEEESL